VVADTSACALPSRFAIGRRETSRSNDSVPIGRTSYPPVAARVVHASRAVTLTYACLRGGVSSRFNAAIRRPTITGQRIDVSDHAVVNEVSYIGEGEREGESGREDAFLEMVSSGSCCDRLQRPKTAVDSIRIVFIMVTSDRIAGVTASKWVRMEGMVRRVEERRLTTFGGNWNREVFDDFVFAARVRLTFEWVFVMEMVTGSTSQ
jgi:hypothetical protein